jgi:hypothetical protein
MVFKLETICGTDEGSNANDGGASCWCKLLVQAAGAASHTSDGFFFHRRASWAQISIE